MAKKNSSENLVSFLPDGTKLLEFNIGSQGDIESVEVKNMSNVMQNDIMAVNIVLQAFLSCFGIDISSIARTAVPVENTCLIDMRNLLINAYWDNTNVTINGVTKKAIDWVKIKFKIYSKADFVDALYRKITDMIYLGDEGQDYTVIKADDETYQMIKFIAYCLNAYSGFISPTVGDTTVIPNQQYSTKEELETILKKLFVDMGLIAENATITIPSAMWSGNDSSRSYLNQKSYATVLIHKGLCDNPLNVVYPTNPNFHEMWTYTIVTSTAPVTSLVLDGFTHTSSDTWNIDNAGSSYNKLYCWQTTFTIAIENSGSNSVFSMMKAFEIGTSENVLNLTYKNYSSFRWGEYYSGDRTKIYLPLPWQWYRQQGTAYWNNIQTADQITTDIYLNCSYTIQTTIPEPIINTAITALLDSIDLLDFDMFYPLLIATNNILDFLSNLTTPIDTTQALQTELINTNDNIGLRTGKPKDEIQEDLGAEYVPTSTKTIPFDNNGEGLIFNSPTEHYCAIIGCDEFNNLSDFLWNRDFWQQFAEKISNFNPFDCIESIHTLPIKLRKSLEYETNSSTVTLAGVAATITGGGDRTVQGHALKHTFVTMRTYEKGIGFDETRDKNGDIRVTAYGSFLDYEPNTTVSIYIPFIGDVNVNASLVMFHYVFLEYRISVITGDFIATLYAYTTDDAVFKTPKDKRGYVKSKIMGKESYPVLTCKGNMAKFYPLASRTSGNALDGLKNAVVGGALMASGNMLLGAGMLANSADAMSNVSVGVKGSDMGEVHGFLANWIPYITVYTHEAMRGFRANAYNSAFNETMGMKTERGIAIKNMDRGFHKCTGVKIDGLRCTNQEKSEIEQLLLNGFYTAIEQTTNEEEGG